MFQSEMPWLKTSTMQLWPINDIYSQQEYTLGCSWRSPPGLLHSLTGVPYKPSFPYTLPGSIRIPRCLPNHEAHWAKVERILHPGPWNLKKTSVKNSCPVSIQTISSLCIFLDLAAHRQGAYRAWHRQGFGVTQPFSSWWWNQPIWKNMGQKGFIFPK